MKIAELTEMRLTGESVMKVLVAHDGDLEKVADEMGIPEEHVQLFMEENPKFFEKYLGSPPGTWWFISNPAIGELISHSGMAGYTVRYYGAGQSGREFVFTFFNRHDFEKVLRMVPPRKIFNVRPMCYYTDPAFKV